MGVEQTPQTSERSRIYGRPSMLALRYTLGESVVSQPKVQPSGSLLSPREERQNQSWVLISAGSEKGLAVGRVGKMFWNV